MIEWTLSGDTEVIARVGRLSDSVRTALHRAMQKQCFLIQRAVVVEKLSGDPLHRRTGVLASSINSTVDDSGDSIIGRVGTKVRYGAVHEYGGTFNIPEHERRVFAGKGKKKTTVSTHTVRAHTATFPERSFLRSVLSEWRPSVADAISQAIADAIQKG